MDAQSYMSGYQPVDKTYPNSFALRALDLAVKQTAAFKDVQAKAAEKQQETAEDSEQRFAGLNDQKGSEPKTAPKAVTAGEPEAATGTVLDIEI